MLTESDVFQGEEAEWCGDRVIAGYDLGVEEVGYFVLEYSQIARADTSNALVVGGYVEYTLADEWASDPAF